MTLEQEVYDEQFKEDADPKLLSDLEEEINVFILYASFKAKLWAENYEEAELLMRVVDYMDMPCDYWIDEFNKHQHESYKMMRR
jgi:hypothetical protein